MKVGRGRFADGGGYWVKKGRGKIDERVGKRKEDSGE